MNRPVPTLARTWPGLPRTPRAVIRFLGTLVLAGFAGAIFAALAAQALGLSMLIAGGVSGTLLAVFVALLIARHGPAA